MKTLGERIKERRKLLKLTQAQVGRKLGVSHVALSQWERDETAPTGANLHNLAAVLECTTAWILYGTTNNEERSLCSTPEPTVAYSIPLITPDQASMWLSDGDGWGFRRQGADKDLLTERWTAPGTFAMTASDHSMEPEIRRGDRVIVAPLGCTNPTPGSFVVVHGGNIGGSAAIIRKYRQVSLPVDDLDDPTFELQPLSDDFPVINSKHSVVKIIGVVVEIRRCTI